MARHNITLAVSAIHSLPARDETIVWDDELGTVEGTHYWVYEIHRLNQEGGIPLDLTGDGRVLVLQDPLHDPRDFWWMLPPECQREPLRSTMPAILREVEPTPPEAAEPPAGIIDSVRRPLIPGVEFVW